MVRESTIRLITRVSDQHKAVNLGQGFTDESAAYEMVWGAMSASLGGTDEGIRQLNNITLNELQQKSGASQDEFLNMKLKDALALIQSERDVYNQYSYPFGLPELRNSIADYTRRFLGFRPDPEKEITVVVGATEGLFVSLKAICSPGDEVAILQPFHEMYRLQSITLDLKPKFITLRENRQRMTWDLNLDELDDIVSDSTKALVLNTPHNPTGKIFTREELESIAAICRKHGTFVVTDEIYEHMLYADKPHLSMANTKGMKEHTFVVNAVSKTANATGWRVGWIISPERHTAKVRAIHDTIVLQSPTPLQKGAVELLKLEDAFFKNIRKGFLEKRDSLVNALRKTGFHVTPPEGAYYLFADYSDVPIIKNMSPTDAAMYLIKEVGVACIPGDNFYGSGSYGDRYLRFAFCRSMETIEEAARRLLKLKQE